MDIKLDDVDAPQYFDFNQVNENNPDDSFFELKKPRNKATKAKEEKGAVFRFTASSSSTITKNQHPLSAKGLDKKRSMKAQEKDTKWVKPVQRKQPPRSKNNPTGSGAPKRPAAFGSPKVVKKLKKTTQPTTPNCLKRSLQKPKVVKSSEEIELERIAELRRQMNQHLKDNRQTMKKRGFQGSALKPAITCATVPAVTKTKNVKEGNNFKGPAPKAGPSGYLRNKSCVPRSDMSITLERDFANPPRTSTPFTSLKPIRSYCNPNDTNAVHRNKIAVAKKLDQSIHSGLPFILKSGHQSSFLKNDSYLSDINKSTISGFEKLVQKVKDIPLKELSITLEKLPFESPVKLAPSNEKKQERKKTVKINVAEIKIEIENIGSEKKTARFLNANLVPSSPLNDITSSYRNREMRRSITDPNVKTKFTNGLNQKKTCEDLPQKKLVKKYPYGKSLKTRSQR